MFSRRCFLHQLQTADTAFGQFLNSCRGTICRQEAGKVSVWENKIVGHPIEATLSRPQERFILESWSQL